MPNYPFTLYANDNSYLRLRLTSNPGTLLAIHAEIDFPDGTTNEFEPDAVGTWRLTRRRDQFKDASGNYRNWVTVQYGGSEDSQPCATSDSESGATTNSVWIIRDSQGRRQDVCLSLLLNDDHYANFPNAVVLAGFQPPDGPALVPKYSFGYAQQNVPRSCFETYYDASAAVSVPTLTSVTAPNGEKFTIDYNTDSVACEMGTLHSIKLPTGGKYVYDYEIWDASFSKGCPRDSNIPGNDASWADKTTGVRTKHELDAGLNELATWQYIPTASVRPDGNINCTTEQNDPTQYSEPAPNAELAVTVITPSKDKNVHYFSIWPGMDNHPVDWNGFKVSEYGLPITRNPARMVDGLPLSSEKYDCDSAGNNCVLKRQTFALYGADTYNQEPASISDRNRHIILERTVFTDDGNKYVQTEYSGEDGFGHSRTITTSGTVGSGPPRSTSTNYNPGSDASGRRGADLYFTPNSAWVLNTFDSQSVTEGTSVTKSLACFDANTGALRRTRVLANGSSPLLHDLITDYTVDTYGNLTDEYSFGGDGQTILTDELCASAIISGDHSTEGGPSAEYHVKHEYQFGVRSKSSFLARGSQSEVHRLLDLDIDQNTGLPIKSRDLAGLATTYDYDVMGRLTKSAPPGLTFTTYAYANASVASGFTPAKVTVATDDAYAGSVKSEYDFDSLGRLHQEKRLMPDNTWSTQETNYDGVGRKLSVSELEATPAHFTTFTYDAFNRTTQVVSPDGSSTSFSYPAGVSQIVSTSKVRTSTTSSATANETAVLKTEYHDALGRLSTVEEQSGPTTSANTTGSIVTTDYAYDAADHLTSVKMRGTEAVQNRIFSYDGRGFLVWESNPESGIASYTRDSHGNVLSTLHGSANTQFDLKFVYDPAGRLIHVDERNPLYDPTGYLSDHRQPFLKVKEFTYGDSNVLTPSADYRKGKLWTVTRYNYPYLGETIFRVMETYEYGDGAGRMTKRVTDIDKGTSVTDNIWTKVRTVDQSVEYNTLGLPSIVHYPSCRECALPWMSPTRDVPSTYLNGRLSAVGNTTKSYVSSISYWPNGMRNVLVHSNSIADTQTMDTATGMPRPNSLSSGLYTGCEAPVITAQPEDATITSGNTGVTLSVAVLGAGVTYQWWQYNNGTGSQLITGATGSSYVASQPLAQSYYVTITNLCRSISSRWVTVSVNQCTAPTAQIVPPSYVSGNGTVSLYVDASGTGPLIYRWTRSPDNAVIGTTMSVTTPISATTTYTVTVSSACSTTSVTRSVTVSIPLPAPAGLTAARTGTNEITVSWSPLPGVTSYSLARQSGVGGDLRVVSGTQITDTGLAPNTTYAYRVSASGSSENRYSNVDVATTMTFSPVASGSFVSHTDFDNLLQTVNAVRAAAGWPAVLWQNIISPNSPLPAPGTLITAQHVTALRARMNEALQALGVPVSPYTDADPQLLQIRPVHINELQERAQ